MQEDMLPIGRELLPGVTLCVCPTEKFKVGRFSLSFLVPLDLDLVPIRTLLFAVLRRGNRTYPTLESINVRLDELYATPYHISNTSRGPYQRIGFSAEFLGADYLPAGTDLFEGVLSLMREMLFHPLTEGGEMPLSRYVDAEKKNTVDYIRSIQNHPSAYAMTRFYETFYREELWGHPFTGDEAQLCAITSEQLRREWLNLLRFAPVRCFYVGDDSPERIATRVSEMLAEEFALIGRDFTPCEPRELRPSRRLSALGQHACVEEQLKTGQSHLILGFRTDVTLTSPDFYAMMLCHEIFGLSPISRLFVHVREKHGICYSCASEYHIDQGDIIVRCGLNESNRETAQDAILEQLRVMQTGEFTDAEWHAARKSLMNSYRQVGDSTGTIANFYELRAILGVDQTPQNCLERFAALTREQVMAAANKITLDTVYFGRGTGEYDETEELDDDA